MAQQTKFTKEDYLQMSGRAGRRGYDNRGNILFHNLKNYKKLMRGELPKLEIKNTKLLPNYSYIHKLNSKIPIETLDIQLDHSVQNPKLYKLIWYLRYYKEGIPFVNTIDKYERELFRTHEKKREYELFRYIKEKLLKETRPECLICYKQNKILELFRPLMVQIGTICKDICNSLHPITYKIVFETSQIIFERIKQILN